MKSVYLSGPITGHSFEECNGWRDRATKVLGRHRIRTLSPMRSVSKSEFGDTKVTNAFMQPGGIMMRDYGDVRRSDGLLVNLQSERVSIGTMFEIAWAWDMKKPVIGWVHPDVSWLRHPMLVAMLTATDIDLTRCCNILVGFK